MSIFYVIEWVRERLCLGRKEVGCRRIEKTKMKTEMVGINLGMS
jgi:hypothetical protein